LPEGILARLRRLRIPSRLFIFHPYPSRMRCFFSLFLFYTLPASSLGLLIYRYGVGHVSVMSFSDFLTHPARLSRCWGFAFVTRGNLGDGTGLICFGAWVYKGPT
jgi:hypothetical protein